MNAQKDFEEFLKLLDSNKVRYVIVGGYAFGFHARPRYTEDLDIFVESLPLNADRLMAVLKIFGFSSPDIAPRDFLRPKYVIQLGIPPVRIDLLTSISGVSFSAAWKGKRRGRYGKSRVWFIGRRELIRNKRASGREKDLMDLRFLEARRPRQKG